MKDIFLESIENPQLVERIEIGYVCKNNHRTIVFFAITNHTEIPNEWDCQYCGITAIKEGSEIEETIKHDRKKYAGDENPAYTMLKERRPGELIKKELEKEFGKDTFKQGFELYRMNDSDRVTKASDYSKDAQKIAKKLESEHNKEMMTDLKSQLKLLRSGKLKRASMM